MPALQPGKGSDYIELENLPSDELLEVIGMSSYYVRSVYGRNELTDGSDLNLVTYLLVTPLRERLYSISRYLYAPQRKRPLTTLRLHASRSFANLRDGLRRTKAPAASKQ